MKVNTEGANVKMDGIVVGATIYLEYVGRELMGKCPEYRCMEQ